MKCKFLPQDNFLLDTLEPLAIPILKNVLNKHIAIPSRKLILMQVGALPTFFMDYLLACVVDVENWGGKADAGFEVEGAEHGETAEGGLVDLVVVVPPEGGPRFADVPRGYVQDVVVLDHVQLLVCLVFVFVAYAHQHEFVL